MMRLPRMIKNKLHLRVLLPLLLSVGCVVAAGNWWIYLRFSHDLNDQMLRRAILFADAVHFAAESAANVQALQRHITALGADRMVKNLVVAEGEPLRVVAATRHAWLGLSLDDLPEPELADLLRQSVQQQRQSIKFDPDSHEYHLTRALLLPGTNDQIRPTACCRAPCWFSSIIPRCTTNSGKRNSRWR